MYCNNNGLFTEGYIRDGLLLHTNILYLQLDSINSCSGRLEHHNLRTYSALQDCASHLSVLLACSRSAAQCTTP